MTPKQNNHCLHKQQNNHFFNLIDTTPPLMTVPHLIVLVVPLTSRASRGPRVRLRATPTPKTDTVVRSILKALTPTLSCNTYTLIHSHTTT